MPLYHAVAHGCRAGLWQEALDDVYYSRVSRQEQFFSTSQLGSFGADLAAVSGFFEIPWTKPVAGLSDWYKGFVLNAAGFRLRALGRLADSAEPMQAALAAAIKIEDWNNAAILASNLSEPYLTLSDVASAVRFGEQSVELADRSGDAFQRMVNRTTLADALHQAGARKQALATFREAEALQKEQQPEYPLLYSTAGFKYCDLLLDGPSALSDRLFTLDLGAASDEERQSAIEICREVRDRADTTLKWVVGWQLDVLSPALDHLTLGRTWLLEAELAQASPSESVPAETADKLAHAERHLNESVSLLRQAGQQDELLRGLLFRAALWRVQFKISNDPSQITKAGNDLAEAEAIAERGSMLIWRIEAALERCRLALAVAQAGKPELGRMESPSFYFDRAQALIRQTEGPYEPHRPDWLEWQPPDYVGVFQPGEIVHYARRDAALENLKAKISELHQRA